LDASHYHFAVALFVVRAAGVVGAPLGLLRGDAAFFDWLLLVAFHLHVASFVVLILAAVAALAKLGGLVLAVALGLLLLEAVHFLVRIALVFAVVDATAPRQ
jgi:hypothetical protein